jgi:glycosyltransferase involved in cell wall biosynthesis
VRVLLVNSSRTTRGGESQTLELGRGLRDRDIVTAFAVRAGSELAGALPEGFEKFEARFETLPSITPSRLRRFIKSWGPDIIHAQTSRAHSHALIARRGLAPLVVSRRTAFGRGSPISALKYGGGVAHFIPISEAAASSLRQRGVPDERMTVVHSGIDVERFSSAVRSEAVREMLGAAGDTLLAGTVAAFEREKGHAVLLEAASILESRGRPIRLGLAGSGSLERSIAADVSRRGIDAGIFHTGPGLPIESFLKALDIFVLPSLEEGLSTGLIAAMAAGLPCVASRTGGIPEVTGDEGAILFEPGDPEGLADAIAALAADPLLREEYSSRGTGRGRLFDRERMIDGTLEVYRRVLRGR